MIRTLCKVRRTWRPPPPLHSPPHPANQPQPLPNQAHSDTKLVFGAEDLAPHHTLTSPSAPRPSPSHTLPPVRIRTLSQVRTTPLTLCPSPTLPIPLPLSPPLPQPANPPSPNPPSPSLLSPRQDSNLVYGPQDLSLGGSEAVRQRPPVPTDVSLHLEPNLVREAQRRRRLQREVPAGDTPLSPTKARASVIAHKHVCSCQDAGRSTCGRTVNCRPPSHVLFLDDTHHTVTTLRSAQPLRPPSPPPPPTLPTPSAHPPPPLRPTHLS